MVVKISQQKRYKFVVNLKLILVNLTIKLLFETALKEEKLPNMEICKFSSCSQKRTEKFFKKTIVLSVYFLSSAKYLKGSHV